MTKEQMTVHKALAELKTIDKRINDAIENSKFIVANKHSNEKIDGKSINDFRDAMKSNYSKVTDLIARRNAIKRAVVMSNAVTKVNIGGVDYTVAEAIDMKNHGMELSSILLNHITYQQRIAQTEVDRNSGDAIEKRAEQYVLSVIQAQPKDSKMSVASDAMQQLRKDYINNNTYDIIDPIGVNNVIEKMNNAIQAFDVDVDAALSVSNALTVIDIEY